MRNILASLVLLLGLILGGTTASAATPTLQSSLLLSGLLQSSAGATEARSPYSGPRHKFAKPSDKPHELADRVRASLRANPLGRAAIDGPKCGLACATPEDFVSMLNASDLRDIAPKNVGDLPAFLDKLEYIKHAPAGTYWMACKSGDGSASSEPIWNCLSRKFHTGEPCWGYNGRCVLARDCTNPVGRELHISHCVRQLVWMNKGDVLRGEPMTATTDMPVNPECPMMVQEPGSDEHAYLPRDKCARADCNFLAPAAYLHMRLLEPRFSFEAQVAGWAVIYLPVEINGWDGVIEYCIDPAGSSQRIAGKDIHRTAYHNGDAYLVYRPEQVPAEWQGTPHVWHADDSKIYSINR